MIIGMASQNATAVGVIAMKYISIPGLNRGCSQIVLGTSLFTPERKDAVFAILDAYVELGGNTLDTARIYSLGKSEEVLGMWLEARRNRQQLIIINKCCHHYIDEHNKHYPEQQRVQPNMITEDLQESLERMKVSYFDLYLLHRDDSRVPVGELFDVLEAHRRAGRIRAYGVSNWSTQRITEAMRYTAAQGYAGIAVNNPSFSLAHINEPRWEGCVYADHDDIHWHEKTQMPLFSWAAQASGFFTGLFTPENAPNPDIKRVYYNQGNWERFRRAGQLAAVKGKNFTANHIALAYVLNQSFPTCAVIGPQTTAELTASFSALPIKLTLQELAWLDLCD